ncbi:MAG: hypothetical protein JSR46_04725 [Verrucomicrobia bacterium]|nr:hypothetical protein [Verrucomicrobiota bacterium]
MSHGDLPPLEEGASHVPDQGLKKETAEVSGRNYSRKLSKGLEKVEEGLGNIAPAAKFGAKSVMEGTLDMVRDTGAATGSVLRRVAGGTKRLIKPQNDEKLEEKSRKLMAKLEKAGGGQSLEQMLEEEAPKEPQAPLDEPQVAKESPQKPSWMGTSSRKATSAQLSTAQHRSTSVGSKPQPKTREEEFTRLTQITTKMLLEGLQKKEWVHEEKLNGLLRALDFAFEGYDPDDGGGALFDLFHYDQLPSDMRGVHALLQPEVRSLIETLDSALTGSDQTKKQAAEAVVNILSEYEPIKGLVSETLMNLPKAVQKEEPVAVAETTARKASVREQPSVEQRAPVKTEATTVEPGRTSSPQLQQVVMKLQFYLEKAVSNGLTDNEDFGSYVDALEFDEGFDDSALVGLRDAEEGSADAKTLERFVTHLSLLLQPSHMQDSRSQAAEGVIHIISQVGGESSPGTLRREIGNLPGR